MVIKVKVNGEWIKVPCAVEEAPKDGQQYVRKDGDWSAVEIPEVDLSGIESSIETIETSINELDSTKASKTEVIEQINAAVASVYKVQGSVDSYDALPIHNVSIGDVYNVLDTGANYVATEIELTSSLLDDSTAVQIVTWDKLSETVDLSNLATKTELSDLTTAVDTAVDELSDKVDTLETSINSIGSTLVTDGDGTKYLSDNGEYKTVASSPLLNEEYGNIVNSILSDQPETISQEDYDKLYSFANTNEDGVAHCEALNASYGIVKIFVIKGDGEIHCYCCIQSAFEGFYISFYIISIKSDLTVTIENYGSNGIYTSPDGINLMSNDASWNHQINLLTTGDGTQYLANDGTYKTLDLGNADEVYISNGEAPTGNQEIWIDTSVEGVDGYILDDAPSDGTTYGRKNGTWTEVTGGGLFNEEYGKIIYDAMVNETISTENFNILKTASLNQEETTGRYVYCEYQYLYMGILCTMFVYTDDGIIAYSTIDYLPLDKGVCLNRAYMCVLFSSEGTVTAEYGSDVVIETGGDGSNVLADNGAYVDLPSQSTFSDTSVNFEPSATYTDFPYQSRIALEGVTANDFVEVVFGINEALSGNYAPVCLTEGGYVTIYSKVSDTITIPTIIIHR